MYKDKRPVFEQVSNEVLIGCQNIDGCMRMFHITLMPSEKFELKIYGIDRKLIGEFDTIDEAKKAAYKESDEFFERRYQNG